MTLLNWFFLKACYINIVINLQGCLKQNVLKQISTWMYNVYCTYTGMYWYDVRGARVRCTSISYIVYCTYKEGKNNF